MATSSFDKKFIINNEDDIDKILLALEHPEKIKVRSINLEEENNRGIEILKLRLLKDTTKSIAHGIS